MRLLILALIFNCFNAYAQVCQDFSSLDLFKNTWSGDTQDFIINSQNKLQLMAPEAGSSFIYLKTNDFDSIDFSFEIKQLFSPSGSNFANIYFMLDKPDLTTASGYFLNFGENGNNDALKLFKLNNGAATLIQTGSIAKLATDPSQTQVRIIIKERAKWSIFTDYSLSNSLAQELSFDEIIPNLTESYAGIYCLYTSTRIDKFLFDNFCYKEFQPDKEPPQLTNLELLDSSSISLTFNEDLDQNKVNSSNFTLNAPFLNPNTVTFISKNKVVLFWNKKFSSQQAMTLTILDIYDLNNNKTQQPITRTFNYYKNPEKGEIVISEVMFNPYGTESDFIEIYNTSENFLNIQGLEISNSTNSQLKVFNNDYILKPKQYLCFSEDTISTKTTYKVPDTAHFEELDLPSFNNDMGNFSIGAAGKVFDSYNYDEDFHHPLLDDVEGVSLEKLKLLEPSENESNWHSSSKTNLFATPGYKNSNNVDFIIDQGDSFTLQNKSFSPNLDGLDNDILVINYQLNEVGYLATIVIFDSFGNKIRALYENELLGQNGFLTWDGTNDNGEKCNIGHYILNIQAFNPQLSTISTNLVCTLKDFLR